VTDDRIPGGPAAQGLRMAHFIEDAPVAIALFDKQMRYIAASRRWLEDYGLVGRTVRGVSHYELFPEITAAWREIHRRALAGETVWADEDPFVRENGRVQWLHWHVRPWIDPDGAIGGIAIFSEDITERKRTQEAVSHLQRLSAIGQLAGGVAHDLNNLLTVISGSLELAESRVVDPDTRSLIAQAMQSAQAGRVFSRRLLTLAAHSPGTPSGKVDLNARVHDVAELIRRALPRGLRLAMSLDAALWPVECDQGEVDSAVINLAINAGDAMPAGGTVRLVTENVAVGAATAALHPNARAGDYVRLSVVDNGVGMAPEVLAHACEPFFTTKPPGKGTGLGLSGVASFVTRAGGFVSIESAVGAGTTVSLHLPRARAPAAAPGVAAPPSPRGDGELILVVEDDPRVRNVTLRRLESLGYAVLEAETGREAVRILASDAPVDLVMSDVHMPGGLSGHDVADWVRAERPHIKVLLASGDSRGGEPAPAAGERVLAKPYEREELARAVRAALRARPRGGPPRRTRSPRRARS
jgi:PAS domain S-box-containing protein